MTSRIRGRRARSSAVELIGGDDSRDAAHVFREPFRRTSALRPVRGAAGAAPARPAAAGPAGLSMNCRNHSSSITSCQRRCRWSALPAAMLAPQAGDFAVVEDAAVAQAAVEQQLVRPSARAGRAATRRSARRSRCFGAFDDRRAAPAARAPAAAGTCSAVLQLQRRRHARGELEQLVIEQRLARLERDRHAHAIDLGQDVVDHVGLDVDVQRAIERIAATRRRGRRRGSWRARSAAADLSAEVAGIELRSSRPARTCRRRA